MERGSTERIFPKKGKEQTYSQCFLLASASTSAISILSLESKLIIVGIKASNIANEKKSGSFDFDDVIWLCINLFSKCNLKRL
jgi:hypothetical protein